MANNETFIDKNAINYREILIPSPVYGRLGEPVRFITKKLDGEWVSREEIESLPTFKTRTVHKPTQSEFRRMAEQLGYSQTLCTSWILTDNKFVCLNCGSKEEAVRNFCPCCGAKTKTKTEKGANS